MGRRIVLTAMAALLAVPLAAAWGDDLNPPDYRGDPLSVFVHWAGDTGLPEQPEFSSVDDDDPSTFLYPGLEQPFFEHIPGTDGDLYQFHVPNFVDELPLKMLRLQLTWTSTTAPPLGVDGIGFEGATGGGPGVVVHSSTPLVFTQPDGGYQYFDLEFRPNPDWETISVRMAPDAELVQVVIDSVSIVPEPGTLGLLALGGAGALAAVRRRRLRR